MALRYLTHPRDSDCVPEDGSVKDNPVLQCLDRLSQLNCSQNRQTEDELVDLLVKFTELFGCEQAVVLALRALASLQHDLKSREAFRIRGGPSILVGILTNGFENIDILSNGFAVVVAAATRKSALRVCTMLYRFSLTPDDNRVLASQVYGYARKFAKIEIVGALVESIRVGLSSSSLVSASIALKAVAVNLAGSDANKNAIVENKGMDRLIKLSSRFYYDSSVLQEIMAVISVLSLRCPSIAVVAIEAGAGELALQAMQKFLAAQQMQGNSCLMFRNLVS
ncbi:hypothetical protein C1H46_036620 [Malus baccata]|uniref:Armadillo repeat-containing domain-containing protein n=1 Tax=Malus baccata TaxID=106549 RepID=A0A540KUP8_MALBA|nr:hypothetical protein C1H46_036620 [Malus baccata]